MLMQTVIYVLTTIVELFVLAVLLRFYAQVFRASFRNPIAQFAVALTDWAVKPLRRVVPSIMGFDSASFLVAWIAQMILWGAVLGLRNEAAYYNPLFWLGLAAFALVMKPERRGGRSVSFGGLALSCSINDGSWRA